MYEHRQHTSSPTISSTDSINHQHARPYLQGHVNTDLAISPEVEKQLVFYNHMTYLLYLFSFFSMGLLLIVPIIMNYARRKEARYSWLASHFDWQIKTFWYGFIMFCVGFFSFFISIGALGISVFAESVNGVYGSMALTVFGVLLIGFCCVWYLYRIIKGWIALSDGRPVL